MDLHCEQIGLNIDGEARVANYGLLSLVLQRLRGYSDNGPIRINAPGRLPEELDPEGDQDYRVFLTALHTLAHHKIIIFKPEYLNRKRPRKAMYRDFSVYVVNRYKLEQLYLELKWLGEPEDKRSEAPQVDNLVFYNTASGRGLMNGRSIYFKKSKPKNRLKPKEMFDLLFASAPNPVPRNKLTATLRLGKDAHDESDRLNDSFNNLRKRCGVTNKVISLHDSGVLNAITVPIDELPDFFIFPE